MSKKITKKKAGGSSKKGAKGGGEVGAFLSELDHPLKDVVLAVREIVLGVSPEIREGIKWNAPSFRTSDDFATFNLRAKDRVRLILHSGATKKAGAAEVTQVPDPSGLLERLAPDRCMASWGSVAEVRATRAALEAILKEWVARM